jgi:hypothetical protein
MLSVCAAGYIDVCGEANVDVGTCRLYARQGVTEILHWEQNLYPRPESLFFSTQVIRACRKKCDDLTANKVLTHNV